MKSAIRLVLVALLLVTTPGFASDASTETAEDFLKSLAGDFAGRGNAVVLGDETTRISCRMTNTFMAETNTLEVAGECASTKGKGEINGSVVAKSNELTGSFVTTRQNVKITQTGGAYREGRMVLTTSMMDEQVGRLIRVRQDVTRTADGIKADFYTYSNKSQQYEPAGSIALKRR